MWFSSQLHSWNCAWSLFLFSSGFLLIYLEPFPHTFPFTKSEFVCLFIFSVQTQKSKALFAAFGVVENWIHWVLNTDMPCAVDTFVFSVQQVWAFCWDRFVFLMECASILGTEKFFITIECLVWFKVSVESASEFSLIFWSDHLCNCRILLTLSSVCVNSCIYGPYWSSQKAPVPVICWTGSFRLQILFLSL